jgi:hypothetical protein
MIPSNCQVIEIKYVNKTVEHGAGKKGGPKNAGKSV